MHIYNKYFNKFLINDNYNIKKVIRRYLFETHRTNNNNLKTIFSIRDELKDSVGFSSIFGRQQAIDKSILNKYKINDQTELIQSRMSDSYAEAIIPIGSQPLYRERYVNYWNHVRIGRLLEDLDTMAVHISYLHNRNQLVTIDNRKIAPIVIVTGLVDQIKLKTNKISIDKDLKISGFTSWVGKTSSETTMRLEQKISDTEWNYILEARFLVCARDALNKGSAIMTPLELVTDEEKKYFQIGEKNKQSRLKATQESLFMNPPNSQDTCIIHDIFKQTVDLNSGSLQNRIIPPNSVWMENSLLKNATICQPEQRNIYNKIFGGFLMRKGFELAWINSCLYSKCQTEIEVIDDITFRKPVLIGSILFLSSQVVYTKGNHIQIKVHAESVNPNTGVHETTNEFYFKFYAPPTTTIPRVIPKTYSEAMIYIDGKRHFEASE